MNNLLSLTPLVGLFGLICALTIFVINDRRPPGSAKMQEISQSIHDGAMAFLKREYTILIAFVIVVAVLIGWQLNRETAICFVTGAACSILAGFIGMKSATRANTRTCEAARSDGVGAALMVAFRGGAVMGLALAGLGLLGVGIFAQVFAGIEQAAYINGFAMGASSIALFARVGGGIYTKAADVGSDLVGKVEAGIPEDDPTQSGGHRRQRGRQRGRCRRHGSRYLRVLRRFDDCDDGDRGHAGTGNARATWRRGHPGKSDGVAADSGSGWLAVLDPRDPLDQSYGGHGAGGGSALLGVVCGGSVCGGRVLCAGTVGNQLGGLLGRSRRAPWAAW